MISAKMVYEILFISSVLLIFYPYIGYPVSLYLIGLLKCNEVNRKVQYPYITLIITAYNEEKKIKDKLKNTLEITYPKDKMQVIVSSDGSTDRTNNIVEAYSNDNLQLLAIQKRSGKENAQKEALKIANGEIIIFTDVATIIDPGGIERIVSNFADSTIGCVSSEDRLIGRDGNPSGEGFYVRYEMFLRRMESKVNSLVGLSGSFFAARKSVCQDFSGDVQSDFRTLLNSVKLGLRGICDPEAIGSYLDISDKNREYERKVRTVLRGLTVFFMNLEFLNVFKYGLFSYQYLCHKLLRWLVPLFLIMAFIGNLLLAGYSNIYLIVFIAQILFYLVALWGWKIGNTSSNLVKIPYYFFAVNASIFVAWWRYFHRQRVVMWTPSDR